MLMVRSGANPKKRLLRTSNLTRLFYATFGCMDIHYSLVGA